MQEIDKIPARFFYNLDLVWSTEDKKKPKEKPYVIIIINGEPYKIYLNDHKEPLYDK